MQNSPDLVLSLTDPGDDMIKRVRYQAAYGALLCLEMLADDDVAAIFCEQHEDLLIKKANGNFVGVQVKTREGHKGPFKTKDEPVCTALTRFVQLDKLFPNSFERFVLVANCDFYDVGDFDTSLPAVLRKVKANANHQFKGDMKTVIEQIRTACGCPKKAIMATLAKVRCDGSVPKLEDIDGNVIINFGENPNFKNLPYPTLERLAEALIAELLKASALSCADSSRAAFVLAIDIDAAKVDATLEAKRVTRERLNPIFNQITAAGPYELHHEITSEKERLATGRHRLEKKMAAGGLSSLNMSLARDHQAATEFVLQEWLHKFGADQARARRGQVGLAVRTQCQEAYDEAFKESGEFGLNMLLKIRGRLQQLAKDTSLTYGLRYEHLLGMVSLDTEACNVWWSKPFKIEDFK